MFLFFLPARTFYDESSLELSSNEVLDFSTISRFVGERSGWKPSAKSLVVVLASSQNLLRRERSQKRVERSLGALIALSIVERRRCSTVDFERRNVPTYPSKEHSKCFTSLHVETKFQIPGQSVSNKLRTRPTVTPRLLAKK